MTTGTAKDPKQYPILRNLQFSPVKEGEEQYVVLWDPSGLSKDKLVLPLNYFFIIQHQLWVHKKCQLFRSVGELEGVFVICFLPYCTD